MDVLEAMAICLMSAGLAVASAHAQTLAPAPAKPTPIRRPAAAANANASANANTNANASVFGDWQVRCQTAGAPPGAQRSCEIRQAVMIEGQTAPFAQIAMGRPVSNDMLLVTVVVPTNADFAGGLRIAMTETDAQPLDLIWRRCAPAGCFASLPAKDEILARWKKLETRGRITFKNANGQDVTMPISFRGLAQALDVLAKTH